jgi:hypothetical protein
MFPPFHGLFFCPQAGYFKAQSLASLWVMPYMSHFRSIRS